MELVSEVLLKGELGNVDLPSLVEIAASSGDEDVAVVINTPQQDLAVFVSDGRVVHAESSNGDEGIKALAKALAAQEGTFRLEPARKAPKITIQQSWNNALLEALRLLDEQEAEISPQTTSKEENMSQGKKTRERIADVLSNLLEDSVDIIGAAVVGTDGLIYSADFPRRDADEALIAATSAAVYGLSKRTMGQISEGDFVQTLIEGTEGYMLVRSINRSVLFVAVLPRDVNLGMAFAESRTVAAELAEILKALA